eukprot:Plantae.Rhodophyta-Hildenbrandia_rubra.ctg1800.p1 GENE.Plantae.Rhodophyta-Hildenbrandia_rubra.ctg1800~~Plantae.Rhodophyta-Hildenbrandia_rubra.ctg1800.p1  ORF type:complete len:528 (+),score=95.65 Plantae.Rhodophyta-Hildenbrandia_rubra.ctg1800:2308-3891(+)
MVERTSTTVPPPPSLPDRPAPGATSLSATVTTALTTKPAVSETPWGLPWSELFGSLRPTPEENARLTDIVLRVENALKVAEIPYSKVVPGASFGKKTNTRDEKKLEVIVIFDEFDAGNYYDGYLTPIVKTLAKAGEANFTGVEEKGWEVWFYAEDVRCRVFAAGVLEGGAKELLMIKKTNTGFGLDVELGNIRVNGGSKSHLNVDKKMLLAETSASLLRIDMLRAQPPVYKDMVRVAKKWRDTCSFLSATDIPGDYLLELIMLEAFHGAPAAKPSPDYFAGIFRAFLTMISAQSASGSDIYADSNTPTTFLSWTTYYNRGAIDHCIAKGLLKLDNSNPDLCSMVIVDPAVPFIDVAATVRDWGEMRRFAKDSLGHFQKTEMVDLLHGRLQQFTTQVEDKLKGLTDSLEELRLIEASDRRFTGVIQFKDIHMSNDHWTPVTECELRCLTWRLNARPSKTGVETLGYNQTLDVSLQVVGKLNRKLDVDVIFRGNTVQLEFDESINHVLVVKRAEIIRNRDYTIQVTVVA